MKEIEITMEETFRVAQTFKVPNSIYEEIKRTSRIPDDYFNLLQRECERSGEREIDYAVWSETEQKQLVEWG